MQPKNSIISNSSSFGDIFMVAPLYVDLKKSLTPNRMQSPSNSTRAFSTAASLYRMKKEHKKNPQSQQAALESLEVHTSRRIGFDFCP
jgi:hypothetical protein